MSTLNALQKQIFEILSGSGALISLIGATAILDHPRPGQKMPHVVIGAVETEELADGVTGVRLQIEAWSSAEGRKEIQAIAECIADAVSVSTSPAGVSMKIQRAEKVKAFRADIAFAFLTG